MFLWTILLSGLIAAAVFASRGRGGKGSKSWSNHLDVASRCAVVLDRRCLQLCCHGLCLLSVANGFPTRDPVVFVTKASGLDLQAP